MNFNSPTYYTMSNLKLYTTLKDFVAQLKTLPAETSTNIGAYKLLEYGVQNNKCYAYTPNCLVLSNSTINTEIPFKNLISDLECHAKSYGHIPVFVTDDTFDNVDRYKLIDQLEVKHNIHFKVDNRKIKDLPFVKIEEEAIKFVELLNANGIKHLKTAKALANEKYNLPNITYDYHILYYDNKWRLYKEMSKFYKWEQLIMDKYDHPIYMIKGLRAYKDESQCDLSDVKNTSLEKLPRDKYPNNVENENTSLEELPLNFILNDAAKDGSLKIVKTMLDRGANNYNEAMVSAAAGGHEKIIHLMLERGANDYNGALIEAANQGHEDTVRWMLELGAIAYNSAMLAATTDTNLKVVKLLLDHGANNYNEVMVRAARGGQDKIVELMLKHGANNYQEAADMACKYGHDNIYKLLVRTEQKHN